MKKYFFISLMALVLAGCSDIRQHIEYDTELSFDSECNIVSMEVYKVKTAVYYHDDLITSMSYSTSNIDSICVIRAMEKRKAEKIIDNLDKANNCD